MVSQQRSRKTRIALGIAGFVVLLTGTPCVLAMIRTGYVRSLEDTGGVFGVAGTALLVLFVGISLLYQAFKSSPGEEPPEIEGDD